MEESTVLYSVVLSKRRTVSIVINADGSVLVRAPKYMKKSEIHHLVLQKQEWILRKQKQLKHKKEVLASSINHEYTMDSLMPYQGKQYPILLLAKEKLKKPVIDFDGTVFTVSYGEFDKKKIREAFVIWYKKRAAEVYLQRIEYYQNIIQEPFGTVRIKDQKSCYGSCSTKRNLNFNWKLILAPLPVLDYVVVHEMCHLKQMNHSPKFWAEVAKVVPDHKEKRRWLRENGSLLEI